MAEQIQLMIRSRPEDIPPASDTVSRWLNGLGAPPAAEYLANLTIEELVTNCIKYGYDDTNEHTIVVDLSMIAGELTVTVTDDGHAFNPLSIPPPDTSLPIDERPIGGLGIHLLRNMSDQMDYARVDGLNRVTLRKRFHPVAGAP